MVPSMSRPTNPYDNATCESFLGTPKREQINATAYCGFESLHKELTKFIDGYYNRLRLHSALGYQSPEGFENQVARARPETLDKGTMVAFFGTQPLGSVGQSTARQAILQMFFIPATSGW